jgi:hypothetical protein
MNAVRLLIRAELRRRWGSLLVVTLLVVLAGGVTLAALAGARRTATSFDRFQDATLSHDVLVFAEGIERRDVLELRSLAGVEAVGYGRQLAMIRPDGEFLAVGGPLDDVALRDVARYRIVDGRKPRPDRPEEVVVPEPLARQTKLRVGDSFRVRAWSQEQLEGVGNDAPDLPEPKGASAKLHVVGISRLPIDLSLQGRAGGVLITQRSFVEKYGADIGNFSGEDGAFLFVRLDDGRAGVDRFLGQLADVLGERSYDVDPQALTVGAIQDSIDILAIGILVFGAVAGIAGLIALGLIIGRQVALLAAGQEATRDLGMSRRHRTVAIAGPLLLAIVIGVVGAVVGAWLASPLMPFGVAGRAEPDPGLQFATATLLIGAAVIVVVLAALAIIAAWRAARPEATVERARRRPSMVARALEAIGLAPPATIGVGMALEPGRGRTSVPVRSSLAGAAVAVLGVAAVAVFAASLDNLVDSPRAYGVNWDRMVDDTRLRPLGDRLCGPIETRLTDLDTLDAVASICSLSIELDGRAVGAVGFRPLRGDIGPTVLEGRAASAPDEVALGTETMEALDVEIGDDVTAGSSGGDRRYRVVGRAVVPSLVDPQAVADGAVFTAAGLARIEPEGNVSAGVVPAVRFRADVDPARAIREIDALPGVGREGGPGLLRNEVPLEVERLQQIDRIPLALAVFLIVLGAIAVGHLLVTSVQRRDRDFAVLKSMGFRRLQTYGTVCAQATTVAVAGVVIGMLVGVAAGAVIWRAAAEQIGVLAEVVFPLPALAVVAVATVLLANLVAAFPAHVAVRTPAAVVLRRD